MSAAALGSITNQQTSQTGNRFSDLSSEDFIRVLISELSNQDPFQPQDSGALLEQLSSLRNIESQLTLQQKLETLVLQNEMAAAGGLIGKKVEGLDDGNNAVSGLVTSVRVQDGKTLLELDSGRMVSMKRVTKIADQ